MLITIVCIVFLCSVYLWRRKRSSSTEHLSPPAMFGQLPLIGHGHLLLVDAMDLYQVVITLSEHCNRQGGVMYAKGGNQYYYIITDPDDALTVANTCLQKSDIYDFAKDWLGDGLITGSGEVWHRHRKLMNPAFSLPMIHGFLEIFNNQAKVLTDNLERYVGQPASKLSSHLKSFALMVSCMTAFGTTDINDKQFYPKYMKAVEEMLSIICRRATKLWLHNNILNALLGQSKRENELIKILRGLTDEIIKTKKDAYANRTTTNVSYSYFIDLMIEQLYKNNLTEQDIKEELDTNIAASFETSAHFLEVALLLIGSHPEVQDKMYKEIMEVVGETDVAKEDLQKLVYTEAVIKECLRYIPVVPTVLRYIDRDVKLKNYSLRGNNQCFIVTYGMNRHPSWGPDVQQFKPERWLDPTSTANKTKAFATFSIGKRACIGKTYAMTSAKVSLVHLLRAYKITTDYTKTKFSLDITLHPVEGNEMGLVRRHKIID